MYLTITTASIRIMLQMRSHLKIHNVDNQQFWPLPRIFVSDICCIAVTTEPVWSVECVALHGLHQPLSLSTRSSYFPIKHRFGDNWRTGCGEVLSRGQVCFTIWIQAQHFKIANITYVVMQSVILNLSLSFEFHSRGIA